VPIYKSSEQLNQSMQLLFNHIGANHQSAVKSVTDAKLIIRLKITTPSAEVTINGRRNPIQVTYGAGTLKPDMEVEIPADVLHKILLEELPLGKAYSSGQIKVRGAMLKSFVLADVFHTCQALYPQVIKEIGLESNV
jgi:hypothetical protein